MSLSGMATLPLGDRGARPPSRPAPRASGRVVVAAHWVRMRLLSAMIVLVGIAVPIASYAGDATNERFSTTFEPAGLGLQVQLSIVRNADSMRWHVRAATGDRQSPQMQERLADWLIASHYGYEVTTEELGDGQAGVILSVMPGAEEQGPPSATKFQIAWIVSRDGERLEWTKIDSAQYSALDGGEQFRFRTRDDDPRLVRIQRGEDSIFCGSSAGSPVMFEEFDVDDGEFEQVLDIDRLVEGAPVLQASTPEEEFTPPRLQSWFQWFAASSDRRMPERRGALIRPLELGDGRMESGWMEGVEGLGRGEFASAQLNDVVALTSIRIVPGLGASQQQFDAYARPTRVLVGLSDGSRYVAELGDVSFEDVASGRGRLIELPEPKKTRCVSVMLLDAQRGKRVKGQPASAPDTTAIAQMIPYSDVHAEDARATAKRVVERIAGEPNARLRERISELAWTLETELILEVRRTLHAGKTIERRRVIPLMANLPATEAVPLLLEFLHETDPDAPEYRIIKRSLAAHYSKAAPGLVGFLREADADEVRKRTDVIRLLGRVGETEHLLRLIEYLGHGDQTMRNERIRAIGAGGVAMVEPLVEYAHWHLNTDGGHDALRALTLLGKRHFHRDQGQMPRPEMYATILDDTESRRTLMRAIRVGKFFAADGFVETVSERFSRHSDVLIRKEAVEAMERYPTPAARAVLTRALTDSSPDVRISAAGALAARDDVVEVLPEVIEYAREESWKPGQRQAFRLLAGVEHELTDELFDEIFRERPNTEAALVAAKALDRARRPVQPELAQQVIVDQSVNLKMRQEMIGLLGLDDSAAGEAFLLDIIDEQRWQQMADEERAQHALRDETLLSLGRRRSQAAQPRLLELVRDADSPKLQKIAIRALAFYADEELLMQLTEWRKAADPRLHTVYDQTISLIARRLDLEGITEDIDQAMEGDESETDPPDGTSEETPVEGR